MGTDRLASLESRVRDLLELVQTLRRENAGLKSELRAAKERLARQQANGDQWVTERADIKSRIEKVLEELDALEFAESVAGEE